MSDQPCPPRAFMSHASEDKEAHARPLATALRAGGVDVWLDEWEMGVGDNLIQKIFSEGIQKTDAVIIILSAKSSAKPWVQKELTVAAVRNIQNALRIIPIRVDSTEVPEVLLDTFWLDWNKEGSATAVAQKIIDQLFGLRKKPPIGPQPTYSETSPQLPFSLSTQDATVLFEVYKRYTGSKFNFISSPEIINELPALGLSLDAYGESLYVLNQMGYISIKDKYIDPLAAIIKLSRQAAYQIAVSQGHDMPSYRKRLVAAVINKGLTTDEELQGELGGLAIGLLIGLLEDLESDGLWRVAHFMGASSKVHSVTPLAERWLKEHA